MAIQLSVAVRNARLDAIETTISTIMDRALPDVRDGLKPSQRRILVAMDDLNLGPRAKYRKCANIAGHTSGEYHPHGESVIYPTLVNMAQPFSTRYPLVDSQGNFGAIDGSPPAAMRYTEARMTRPTVDVLADRDLDCELRVGPYGVTLDGLESMGLDALRPGPDTRLLYIFFQQPQYSNRILQSYGQECNILTPYPTLQKTGKEQLWMSHRLHRSPHKQLLAFWFSEIL